MSFTPVPMSEQARQASRRVRVEVSLKQPAWGMGLVWLFGYLCSLMASLLVESWLGSSMFDRKRVSSSCNRFRACHALHLDTHPAIS